jgi:hypothetical protein
MTNLIGNNIAGADILGAKYVRDLDEFFQKNEAKYQETPVFSEDIIPRGASAHIGEGIFLTRCTECDDYALTYGMLGYIYELAQHKTAHGLTDVPGLHVALLAQ